MFQTMTERTSQAKTRSSPLHRGATSQPPGRRSAPSSRSCWAERLSRAPGAPELPAELRLRSGCHRPQSRDTAPLAPLTERGRPGRPHTHLRFIGRTRTATFTEAMAHPRRSELPLATAPRPARRQGRARPPPA